MARKGAHDRARRGWVQFCPGGVGDEGRDSWVLGEVFSEARGQIEVHSAAWLRWCGWAKGAVQGQASENAADAGDVVDYSPAGEVSSSSGFGELAGCWF